VRINLSDNEDLLLEDVKRLTNDPHHLVREGALRILRDRGWGV
jgi:hypothetical protein